MSDQRAKIVFLDRGTLAPDIKLGEFSFPHQLFVHERTHPSEVAKRIRDADRALSGLSRAPQPGARDRDIESDGQLVSAII